MFQDKRLLVFCMCLGLLFVGTAIQADDFPDMITMQADYEHKKGIIDFSHGKHFEEYKIGCGECHHNDKGEPLNDLKEGDPVQSCFECHKTPGERPKGKDAPKLSKKERLEYHAEALHYNCIDCHKDYNRKNKTKAAPQTCKKCHPKTKK